MHAMVGDCAWAFFRTLMDCRSTLMRNGAYAILVCQTASVDEALGRLGLSEGQAEIDASLRGGLDLGVDMVTIQRHNGQARTGLDVVAQLKGHLQQAVVYGPQMGFAAGVL